MTYELPEGDYIGPYKWFSADTLRAEVAKAEQRGAEAMRERCIRFFTDNDDLLFWGLQAAQHIKDVK